MGKLWWTVVGVLTVASTGISGSVAALAPDAAPGSRPALDRAVHARLSDAVSPAISLEDPGYPPQQVIPGVVLVKRHDNQRHNGRADQRFYEISTTGSNDVPVAALRAYHHAADVLAGSNPACHLPWTFLAAIGRVESDHGRYGGSQLGADGISRPEILGPVLDGAGPFAAISDTDNGRLDHNKVWDRAVGQMQFLPSTWAAYGRDGDGDGIANPNDINDSALAAGSYLCAGGGDLATTAGMSQAAWRYNQSDYYVALVLAFQRGYATGVFVMPSPPAPDRPAKHKRHPKSHTSKPAQHKKHHRAQHAARPKGHHTGTSGTTTSTSSTSGATTTKHHTTSGSGGSSSSPTPSPSPTPTPDPTTRKVSGTWASCGTGWCLDGAPLDLGTATQQGQTDPGNVDNDATTTTWADEFPNLVGTQVTVVVPYTGPLTVQSIDDIPYP